MKQSLFNKLEEQIVDLIEICKFLQTENNELRTKQAVLAQERNHLLERNRQAAEQVKKVVQRIRTFKA